MHPFLLKLKSAKTQAKIDSRESRDEKKKVGLKYKTLPKGKWERAKHSPRE